MRNILWVGLFLAMFLGQAQDLNSLYKQSMEAYKNKDFQKFKALNQEALTIHPSQPTILYNLAASYSLTGDAQSAKNTLQQLLSWNALLEFEKDADFEAMVAANDVLTELKDASKTFQIPKTTSEAYAEIDAQYHIEDLVQVGKTLYMTDIREGRLIAYNLNTKQSEVLLKLPGALLAIVSDTFQKSVWVSMAALPQFQGTSNEKEQKAILVAFDITKKEIISEITLPDKAVVGSMVIDQQGRLYASNSGTPEIFVVDTRKKELLQTIPVPDARNLQGITLDPNNQCLFVADYIKGICKISIKDTDKTPVWMRSPQYLLKGIDGLTYLDEKTLLSIQNNTTPKRLIKINHDEMRVVDVLLLDNALPVSGEPTNGSYDPEIGFMYISNSQWPHYDKEAQPILDQWEPQQIRLLKLGK